MRTAPNCLVKGAGSQVVGSKAAVQATCSAPIIGTIAKLLEAQECQGIIQARLEALSTEAGVYPVRALHNRFECIAAHTLDPALLDFLLQIGRFAMGFALDAEMIEVGIIAGSAVVHIEPASLNDERIADAGAALLFANTPSLSVYWVWRYAATYAS